MTDDHIKRFNLSEGQPRKAFSLSKGDTPTIKTKDNAQPIIPPPRMFWTPHPHLAPPGMMGSRLAKDAERWMEARREAAKDERAFKPLVNGPPDRSRGR